MAELTGTGEVWSARDKVNLLVEKAIYGGKMMGSAPDGRVVWLSSAQPLSIGDEVTGRVTKVAKRSFEVEVIEVTKPSVSRLDPICPHVSRCGGCPWQSLTLAQQLESLERDIGRMLSRALGELVSLAPSYVGYDEEAHAGRSSWRDSWRHTARLHCDHRRVSEQPVLGFYGPGGLLDLDHCPVFVPLLNEMLQIIRDQCLPTLAGGRSEIRLSVAQGAKSGTIAVSLFGEWSEERLLMIQEKLERIINSSALIHGASLEAHTPRLIKSDDSTHRESRERLSRQRRDRRRQRGGKREQSRRNRGRIRERREIQQLEPLIASWGEAYNIHHGVTHPASAFMQAHQVGNRALIDEVVEGAHDAHSLLELYAGSGNFTLPLARRDPSRSIVALEYDPKAVESLQRIANEEGLKIQATSKFIDSLPVVEADHILLDPPRAGAAQVIDELAECSASKITYISCHPAALARDLERLARHGWSAEKIRIFHLFPHSGHAEVYCRLSRKDLPHVT